MTNFSYLDKMKKLILGALLITICSSCSEKDNSVSISFEVFCEMVANDAKPLALSHPMDGDQVDEVWDEFAQMAEKYQVQIHREDDFPISLLFPAELTEGKTVVLIYNGNTLTQYEQWKADVQGYEGNDRNEMEGFARRFGRLLGYTPQGINQLLRGNSDYRDLASFNVDQQITHLYYDDTNEALEFYNNTLGLKQINASLFQISADAFIQLHPFDSIHGAEQPKSTAIALLTDQLAEWYAYAQEKNIPIKYTYKPKEGGPHDGFVAIDPGGYLLEIEQFKQHPENESFMAALAQATPLETSVQQLNFYGSITWTYHKDMLKMQQFYEEVLGYRLVADQGWTKIYQTSTTGFIGLVDERRGMENYADKKAIEIEWLISDLAPFDTYAQQFWQQYGYDENSLIGPEKYIYHVRDSNF
jgi:catechol 2,3-dioxygenase-like lactoylglutathione lyase family enzyme